MPLLEPLIRGHHKALWSIDESCWTVDNFRDGSNPTTANPRAPLGVLGGSVAAYKSVDDGTGDFVVVPFGFELVAEVPESAVGAGDGTPAVLATSIAGLFMDDANVNPLDDNGARASGKITILNGMGTYKIRVYTTNADGTATGDVKAAVPGTLLYGDPANGLLSTVVFGDAVCKDMKTPTATDPVLVVDMVI